MTSQSGFVLELPSEEATLALGGLLAGLIPPPPLPAILLIGDLGAGKTTFVRGLASALPGCESAEVSSPSFNIFNIYPTTPQVVHFDLYRLENRPFDETMTDVLPEYLGRGTDLIVVEWAQFIPDELLPPDFLSIRFLSGSKTREIHLTFRGKQAKLLFDAVLKEKTQALSIR